MRAQYAGFVGRGSRSVVSDDGVLAEGHTDAHDLAARQHRSHDTRTHAYLLGNVLHVLADQVVAGGVEQGGEAPGIPKGHHVRLAGEEVDVEDLEEGDLGASDVRLVDAIALGGVGQGGPHEMGLAVLALLKVGHEAVDDEGPRGEEIDGVNIAVGGASVGDLFDVWIQSSQASCSARKRRGGGGGGGGEACTGDVLVQDGVLVEDVVDEALAIGVQHQHLPVAARDVSDGLEEDVALRIDDGRHDCCCCCTYLIKGGRTCLRG
ncbi:hypothetical protein Tdes44962_MAKER06010 [Teratosphaeria destructans]|uniref:Uncharacterized protein n=1 Tax=Teratosphaeria destructans TaxID=418781 RepID=A0A9W7SIC9_9PEZI|nr:hypothetical protein Tdes44962_MAKER06010 [Teratosphaeria destructans]